MKTAGGVHRFSHAAMNTTFEIRCAGVDAAYGAQAAEAAWRVVDRLEQEQSRFIPNSDVARINALAAGEAARVSAETMECLEIAQRMYAVTGGAFDVALGTGLDGLELHADELTVSARRAGIRLDLGGIAKGFAVDRVAELLEDWEVPRALIHGGWSSVLALEPPPDADGWALTLRAPAADDPRVLARLSARQRALSASGTQKGDHIVDPSTGAPAARRAVWVALDRHAGAAAADAGAIAETLSTAFMVLTAEQAAALCRQCPGCDAWLYEADGVVQRIGGAIAHNDVP